MSPLRPLLLALGVLQAACVLPARAARDRPLPPPAQGRVGARVPGADPAPGERAVAVGARALPHDVAVRRAVETAASLLGAREITVGGVQYGDRCAALVRAAYHEAGAPLPAAGDAQELLAAARARGALRRWRPAAGDLVFLSDRPGGPAEHVGLVEAVSREGTARVLHLTEHGVARIRVDVAHAWKVRSQSGRALNDLLVVGGGRVPAGRLVIGFATLL